MAPEGSNAPTAGVSTAMPTQQSGSWQPVPSKVQHITQRIHIGCARCAAPIPVNGPCRSVHCDQCMSDMPIDLSCELELASEGMQRVGSLFQRGQFKDPVPDCISCGENVPIEAYWNHVGATTTIPCPSCGAGLPTYPAPEWLRNALPTALQVFGGDPQLAAAEAGLQVEIDQTKPEPIVMACPKCGGGLSLTCEAERTTTCEFCSASVFLPDELWRRLHPVKMARAWTLTYSGTSLQSAASAEAEARQNARRAEGGDRSDDLDVLAARLEQKEQARLAEVKSSRLRTVLIVGLSLAIPLAIMILTHGC